MAQLSVLLDCQLIRAVKSPLLNNQHGAFWLLWIGGRGKEAEQPAWLLLIPDWCGHQQALLSGELGYLSSPGPGFASPTLMGCGAAGVPLLPLAQVSGHQVS